MRRVWPHAFLLRASALLEAVRQKRLEEVPLDLLPRQIAEIVKTGRALPMALRWTTTPQLGFPRKPFAVWRRIQKYALSVEIADEVAVDGAHTIDWPGGEMYVVRFSARPDAGRALLVRPLDVRGDPIPGYRDRYTTPTAGYFRVPGIAALEVFGEGKLEAVRGEEQNRYANLDDWQRIDVVGLPFRDGEVDHPVYDGGAQQGFDAPSLDGFKAAHVRLRIARALSIPWPDIGDPQIPTPAWPDLDPGGYLDRLRDPALAPLQLIEACLNHSDDADPGRLQVRYRHQENLDGIRQTDLPGAPAGDDPARFDVPVVPMTMLSVGHDSEAAVALGYGTVDFLLPQAVEPPLATHVVAPTLGRTGVDYMVTATFVLPFLGPIELAALMEPRVDPTAATELRAKTMYANRAPARDQPASEVVQVGWDLTLAPQSWYVVASHEPGASDVRNARRVGIPGWDPFIPQRPAMVDGGPPVEARTRFTDPVVSLPLSGTRTSHYLVVGRDVFARWTGWARTPHTAEAPAVLLPGLHEASLDLDGDAAVGRSVPASATIEFSWDWTDRSPDRIVFTGRFFPTSGTPPTAYTGGFGLTDSAPGAPALVVSFDAAGHPSVISAHTATVTPLTQDPPDPERRRYRLVVGGLTCDFALSTERAWAVYARAAEAVRSGELSDVAGPRVARAFDPIPAAAPVLPPDIHWTALPDADGKARAELSWPASPGAAGYFVWEATEAALRAAVAPTLDPSAPQTSLLARASELLALLSATPQAEARSMQAFSRLNERKQTATSREVVLPGAAEGLYVYRVSTVSATGVEGARSSDVALVAVPHRSVPGEPRLVLRAVEALSPGVRVAALEGKGAPPLGYRVHRVRNPGALADVGLMGPPHVTETDPGWTDYTEPALNGGDAGTGKAIVDPVTPGWQPYFYRVVAVAVDDPVSGRYGGESPASAVQSIVVPPPDPPSLDEVTPTPAATVAASNRVLTFRTDLPVRRCPLGAARVKVVRLVTAADGTLRRETIIAARTHEIPANGPLAVLVAPTSADLAALPEISRTAPDSAGRTTFYVRMDGAVTGGVVTVTDPLGRVAELAFPEVP